MTKNPEFKWRRTKVRRRDGSIVFLPDNWLLINLSTGLPVAQLCPTTGYQDRPAWCVIFQIMSEEGELKDSIMTWMENSTKAREYAEAQTGGLNYRSKRKRAKNANAPKKRFQEDHIKDAYLCQ